MGNCRPPQRRKLHVETAPTLAAADMNLSSKDRRDMFALTRRVSKSVSVPWNSDNLGTGPGLYVDGYKHLRAHVATAAFDSNDNVDAPKCHPNTREVFSFLNALC